jgi:hypothetical protein
VLVSKLDRLSRDVPFISGLMAPAFPSSSLNSRQMPRTSEVRLMVRMPLLTMSRPHAAGIWLAWRGSRRDGIQVPFIRVRQLRGGSCVSVPIKSVRLAKRGYQLQHWSATRVDPDVAHGTSHRRRSYHHRVGSAAYLADSTIVCSTLAPALDFRWALLGEHIHEANRYA